MNLISVEHGGLGAWEDVMPCYRKYRVKGELSGRVRVLVIGLINRRVKEKKS